MLGKEHLHIISELRKDARQSLVDVIKQTNIPHSTIHQRVKEYEQNIIKKYSPLLDFKRIGFYNHCFLLIKIPQEYKEALKSHLLQHKNMNGVYRIDSGFDFLIECVFRDVGEQKDFIESLSRNFGVEAQKIDVLDPLLQENFLTDLSMFAPQELI